MLKKFLITFSIIISISLFYYIGSYVNYPVHRYIKMNLVEHPEFIPNKDIVKLSGAGFDNLISDFYWLDAIQYIGGNAVSSEYKKYLYPMLNLITDINPYFTFPYQIGELLLTNYNERYENLTKKEIDTNNKQAIDLALKGIEKNCDMNKVRAIKDEYNLSKLWTDDKYKNPCTDFMIPYLLAYIYHWNLYDSFSASYYYKVTAANLDAPIGSRIMAAIMQGKGGDREKSIIMFLSLASNMSGKKDKECRAFSDELGGVLLSVFNKNLLINGKFLNQVDALRKKILKDLGEENVDQSKTLVDNFCSNYLNKSVRELNLLYLEKADKTYLEKSGQHARNAKVLFDKKAIDYLPIDFQKDKNFEIIYFYNSDTKNWDYKAGDYNE